jgi:hypothetical protein
MGMAEKEIESRRRSRAIGSMQPEGKDNQRI